MNMKKCAIKGVSALAICLTPIISSAGIIFDKTCSIPTRTVFENNNLLCGARLTPPGYDHDTTQPWDRPTYDLRVSFGIKETPENEGFFALESNITGKISYEVETYYGENWNYNKRIDNNSVEISKNVTKGERISFGSSARWGEETHRFMVMRGRHLHYWVLRSYIKNCKINDISVHCDAIFNNEPLHSTKWVGVYEDQLFNNLKEISKK